MRFAVYFTPPPDDPLTMHASAWIGRDAFTGKHLDQPDVPGIPPGEISALTAFPRHYGFHGTLKAPFRLASGCSCDELVSAFESFCHRSSPLTIPRLVVAQLGSFIALVPENPVTGLNNLADEAVRSFEPMRASLTADEIARRNPNGLTDTQEAHLRRWGYPYVFDEFRFHMTLTGPVDNKRAYEVAASLRAHFTPVLRSPVIVNSLGLYVQERPGGDFIVREFCPLSSENLVTA